MKINNSMKCIAALLGSLAMVATQVDAKPGHGKGNSGFQNIAWSPTRASIIMGTASSAFTNHAAR